MRKQISPVNLLKASQVVLVGASTPQIILSHPYSFKKCAWKDYLVVTSSLLKAIMNGNSFSISLFEEEEVIVKNVMHIYIFNYNLFVINLK